MNCARWWLLAGLLLSGCSTRQWYEAQRTRLAADCQRLPDRTEYLRCLEAAELGFEDYQRRRHGIDSPGSGR